MTHRIETFFMTHRIELLFCRMTHRIEPFFEYDSKNCFFFEHDSKELNLPLFLVWLRELNLFFCMAHRIEPLFLELWLIELNLFLWLIELNPFLWLIELNFFLSMIQRIESLFEYDSKNRFFLKRKRLTELNPSFHPQKWTPLFNDTKSWTFLVFQHDSKNWIFSWLTKNWTGFLEYDSKNWERILSKMTRRIELFLEEWLKQVNFVSKEKSQRVEFFWFWSKELFLFFFNLTRRNWTFFQYVSMNWTFFLNMTHWIEPFLQKKWLKECFEKKVKNDSKNWFFEYNSQNWTQKFFFFWHDLQNWTHFFNMTHRIFSFTKFLTHRNDWSCLEKWLKELNPFVFFFSTMTQRIELFVNDSFNWASFMNLFSIRVELLFLSDSKNWTFFQYDSKDFEYFSKIWTLFTTQRIDPFLYDSKKLKFLVDKKLNSFQRIRTQRIQLFFSKQWCKVVKKMIRRIEPSWKYDS